MSQERERQELRELAGIARELVAWSQGGASIGLPRVEIPPLADAPAGHTAAPRAESGPAEEPVAHPVGRPVGQSDGPLSLEVLAEQVAGCTACTLHKTRTNTVFARGAATADLMFIGEGPGFHEDQQGVPFVGKAGQLLDRMVVAMGYGRDDVYICNVVKCRPPENRTPLPDEARACQGFLEGQVATVAPKAIVALGRCAAENLGCVPEDGRSWRGRWGIYRGIPVMPTYHPAFLLRSPHMKRPVWEDLQQVMARIGKQAD